MHALFNHFFKELYRYAYFFVGDDALAKDVVQDVFLKLWKNKQSIPRILSIDAYLRTAVRNTCLDYLKRQPFSELTPQLLQRAGQEASPLDKLSLQELELALDEALQALPERCQVIFTKVYRDGLKYKEVAEHMQISINTVKTQLRIALNRIRSALHKFKDF